jgi:hypothetical protein
MLETGNFEGVLNSSRSLEIPMELENIMLNMLKEL